MTDRDWMWTGGTVLAIIILWWAATHRKQQLPSTPAQASGALPVHWDQPMIDPYAANPNQGMPATPGGPTNITVNVPDPFANILSQTFVPLFGFVGMAQGALFQ